MAKKTTSDKVVYQNVSVRKISNGFIVSESKETANGGYSNTERYSATNPIKITTKETPKNK